MPQMSPMNWLILCTMFLLLISLIKSNTANNQKNFTQTTSNKKISQNNIKW